MDNEIDKLLQTYPLLEAERITGKSYKEDDSTGWLGMGINMALGESKRKALSAEGDTHFGIAWEEFQKVALRPPFQFEVVFKQKFKGKEDWHKVKDEEIIFYDAARGIVLHAESYGGKTVNSAEAYYQVDFKTGDKVNWNILKSASGGCISRDDNTKHIWGMSVDCREAMKHKLLSVENSEFGFLKDWYKPQFMSLSNYAEDKETYETQKELTEAKKKLLPKAVIDKWEQR